MKYLRRMLTMNTKKEEAVRRYISGYNCAQSVACTFADEIGMDEQELFKLTEGFGMGMCSKNICGAVAAMQMIASYLSSDGNLEEPQSKRNTYKMIKQLQQEFIDKNQSIICEELLGAPGKPKLRECPGCIEDAAAILEEHFFSEQ
jgi:C_GCAxxG_C_C family probable redox protein